MPVTIRSPAPTEGVCWFSMQVGILANTLHCEFPPGEEEQREKTPSQGMNHWVTCASLSSSKNHWAEELLLIKQRGSKNPWHNLCLQMNSEENEVRKVIQNHRMTTMAELWIWAHPPIWLPAHWWQRHTKAAGSWAPAQQVTALVPLPPSSSLYLPKKPSEFTILIKIVACGSRARNSQPSWATVKPTTQWVSL